MKVCLSCGQVAETTDAFCPRCGKPLPAAGPVPPPPGYSYLVPAPSAPGPEESAAIAHFGTASLLGMIAFLISTASGVIGIVYLRDAFVIGSSGNTVTISTNVVPYLWVAAGIDAVSFAILIGSFLFYRKSFVGLAPHASAFSTPATFAIIAMVGAAILIPGAVVEAGYSANLIQCLNQTGNTASSCLAAHPLLGSLALIGVAGLLFFIGLIGVLVGVWRVGVRYQRDLPKAGAVLSIFPYVNWIGMLLNYVGAREILTRLRGGGGPGLR